VLNYDSTAYRWHCKLQVAAYSRGSGLRILVRLMFRLQWWKSLITSAKRSFSNKHSLIDPLLASSPELEGFKAISRNAPSQGRVNIPSCKMVASFSVVLDPRLQTSMLGRSVVAPYIANIITRGSNHPSQSPTNGRKGCHSCQNYFPQTTLSILHLFHNQHRLHIMLRHLQLYLRWLSYRLYHLLNHLRPDLLTRLAQP
jgi:hypothetical protein